MTSPPLPLANFIQDANLTTFGLFNETEEPLAFTSVYKTDKDAGHVMLGYTVVLPESRGQGFNDVMTAALFHQLQHAGGKHRMIPAG